MSLIEVLVGIGISVLILGGLFQFAVLSSQSYVSMRQRVRITTNLSMARDELSGCLQFLEPEFWNRFRISGSPFFDHEFQGAVSIDPNSDPDDARFVFWDLWPTPNDTKVYVVTDANYPVWIAMTPKDSSAPPGPANSIGHMSVLLLVDDETIFPVLVSEVQADAVFLFAGGDALWDMPEAYDVANSEIVCLGTLCVTQCELSPEPGRKNKLVYRPWFSSHEGWKPGRRRSSFTQIDTMTWVRSDGSTPHRIVLKSSLGEDAPGGQKEEICVVLEL